jgi:hypothetical protein
MARVEVLPGRRPAASLALDSSATVGRNWDHQKFVLSLRVEHRPSGRPALDKIAIRALSRRMPGSTDPPAERSKGRPRLSPGQRLQYRIREPSCFFLGAKRRSNLDRLSATSMRLLCFARNARVPPAGSLRAGRRPGRCGTHMDIIGGDHRVSASLLGTGVASRPPRCSFSRWRFWRCPRRCGRTKLAATSGCR